jgi:hypothetical protein
LDNGSHIVYGGADRQVDDAVGMGPRASRRVGQRVPWEDRQ